MPAGINLTTGPGPDYHYAPEVPKEVELIGAEVVLSGEFPIVKGTAIEHFTLEGEGEADFSDEAYVYATCTDDRGRGIKLVGSGDKFYNCHQTNEDNAPELKPIILGDADTDGFSLSRLQGNRVMVTVPDRQASSLTKGEVYNSPVVTAATRKWMLTDAEMANRLNQPMVTEHLRRLQRKIGAVVIALGSVIGAWNVGSTHANNQGGKVAATANPVTIKEGTEEAVKVNDALNEVQAGSDSFRDNPIYKEYKEAQDQFDDKVRQANNAEELSDIIKQEMGLDYYSTIDAPLSKNKQLVSQFADVYRVFFGDNNGEIERLIVEPSHKEEEGTVLGGYDHSNDIVHAAGDISPSEFLTVAFHELTHAVDEDNNNNLSNLAKDITKGASEEYLGSKWTSNEPNTKVFSSKYAQRSSKEDAAETVKDFSDYGVFKTLNDSDPKFDKQRAIITELENQYPGFIERLGAMFEARRDNSEGYLSPAVMLSIVLIMGGLSLKEKRRNIEKNRREAGIHI